MENHQKASEIILGLKSRLRYNEKKLLQEGTVLPVITSIRKRSKRFYHFALATSFLLILSLTRVFFLNVSFFDVLFPTGFGIFLAYFVHRDYNHIEDTLKESESFLEK
tara:strand:- start:2191 stop:2514 length:324 start_codon:yes stop_codon:yes gene_type:complete